jgi:hypothetical protein
MKSCSGNPDCLWFGCVCLVCFKAKGTGGWGGGGVWLDFHNFCHIPNILYVLSGTKYTANLYILWKRNIIFFINYFIAYFSSYQSTYQTYLYYLQEYMFGFIYMYANFKAFLSKKPL